MRYHVQGLLPQPDISLTSSEAVINTTVVSTGDPNICSAFRDALLPPRHLNQLSATDRPLQRPPAHPCTNHAASEDGVSYEPSLTSPPSCSSHTLITPQAPAAARWATDSPTACALAITASVSPLTRWSTRPASRASEGVNR